MADYRSRLAASVDRYDHVGSQSSPEDEANCRSQQERVGAFMPLSDRSLVVLASQIEQLKAHIEDINKQHVEEVGELIIENKHLQEHIRKIQEELQQSREMSAAHINLEEERLAELQQHIRNLEAEICRRQQRELLLIEDNDSLSAQLQLLQQECERHREAAARPRLAPNPSLMESMESKLTHLQREKTALESENSLLVRTVEAIRNEKENLERDLQCLLELKRLT